jgi:glycosyltransferase involved in cell wall biosynthesis
MKRITVLVSNDLEYDQRVRKVCATLTEMGFKITLVGRRRPHSKKFQRPYKTRRFRLLFNSGALFYANLNLRLFFYLLFKRTDIILANDLDTLWPAWIVGKWRSKEVVYDSHEYFTEASGLTGRPFPKRVWTSIEKRIFPKLKRVYTVNESIAKIYRELYQVDVKVVRNVPPKWERGDIPSREQLGLPTDKKIILLQGAFIDHDRGCLEAVECMQYVENALLLVIGEGQALPEAKELTRKLQLDDRVEFKPRMPFEELRQYTAVSDLGLSLDRPDHLNYKLSLPNKIFDYIQSRTPVLVSDLPELKRVMDQYNIGLVADDHDVHTLAKLMQRAVDQPDAAWVGELERAAKENNWEQESEVIQSIYEGLA